MIVELSNAVKSICEKIEHFISPIKSFGTCHAVFVGDSYFFETMKVVDGLGNCGNISLDNKGLYVYRDSDQISINEKNGDREYLRPHVQKLYKDFKESSKLH
jgi:hypothetical protein